MTPPDDREVHDLVLHGGRVIDPDSGTDGVCDVAVDGGTIRRVSPPPLRGRTVVDVSGLVVCPGFVDMHSHGQGIIDLRIRALDGVTTALELESGAYPVEAAYQRAADEGRPIHYGFSTSWAMARIGCVTGDKAAGGFSEFLPYVALSHWQVPAASKQVRAIIDRLDEDLAAGAVGIGVLLGYAPGTHRSEYVAVGGLAAARNTIAFTHARDIADADVRVDGAGEIVQVAGETGAHMHFCHVNSMALRRVEEVIDVIEKARLEGSRITTEAYPYGAGMTGIGAGFLAPDRLAPQGLAPDDILYAPTGERVTSVAHLERLRRTDPGGLCFVDHFREEIPEDFHWVERALVVPGMAIASDAIPLTWSIGRPDDRTWPPPPGAITHPRTAGTFGRVLRFARQGHLFDLPEAVARCTIVPAGILQDAVPAMARKARIQAGCDADIVVFDPDLVTDQATYLDTIRPTIGIRHVLVDGVFVVRDSVLQEDVLPGRPIRAGTHVS